jgi:hypothetical protein
MKNEEKGQGIRDKGREEMKKTDEISKSIKQ